jgi:hypothetical protein
VAFNGNWAPEFFSSTVPSSAAVRAKVPSAVTGIGVVVCLRSNMPNRIIVANRLISRVSMVFTDSCPDRNHCVHQRPEHDR